MWKVISICPEQSHNLPKIKIIPLLKNIFIAFGFDGLRKQVKNFKITVIDSRNEKNRIVNLILKAGKCRIKEIV